MYSEQVKINKSPSGGRGIFAIQDLKKGERIFSIPEHQTITLDVVKESEIGKLIQKVDLVANSHSMFAAFLLFERLNKNSTYSDYIGNLPTDLGNFPLFFSGNEKSLLSGSPILSVIEAQERAIEHDYLKLCDCIPGFKKFSLLQFQESYLLFQSRAWFHLD